MDGLIDINVAFGPWPFREVGFGSPAELRDHLRGEGIETALVSHLGAVFHPDPDVYNRPLIEACRRLDGLEPVPVVNPHLPGWRARLDAYRARAGVRAVKLLPSYHRYRLYTRPVFDLVEYLAEAGVRLMVQMRLEDERQQVGGLRVRGVPVGEVVRLHRRFPDVPFVCLNAYLPEARRLGEETTGVGVDLSFAEWLFTLDELRAALDAHRLFFGSHTPLLITRASVMKLTHAPRPDAELRRIGRDNPLAFFGLSDS